MAKSNEEIIEGIKSTLRKWTEIRENIWMKRNVGSSYYPNYWVKCGYCSAFWGNLDFCGGCPLYTLSSIGIVYCVGNGMISSVARKALELADKKDWDEALRYVDILLAKVREDLKHWEGNMTRKLTPETDRKPFLCGEKNQSAKLTREDVVSIRAMLASGVFTQAAIAKHHKVSQKTISSIKLGKTWVWL